MTRVGPALPVDRRVLATSLVDMHPARGASHQDIPPHRSCQVHHFYWLHFGVSRPVQNQSSQVGQTIKPTRSSKLGLTILAVLLRVCPTTNAETSASLAGLSTAVSEYLSTTAAS